MLLVINASPQASGRNTATAHTEAEITLAMIHEVRGSPIPSPKDIPSVIIRERASVNCRKGQTSTSSSREAAAAEALRKSATSKCKAAAAAAMSIITNAGNHSQRVTSEWLTKSEGSTRTAHAR